MTNIRAMVAIALAVAASAPALARSVDPASATDQSPRTSAKSVIAFYNDHPANRGRPGYVVVVRLSRRLPAGTEAVARLGANFPLDALDSQHGCYSGGIPPVKSTNSVRYGKAYTVGIWTGAHPDPDKQRVSLTSHPHLKHKAAALSAIRRLGCSDRNGYLR